MISSSPPKSKESSSSSSSSTAFGDECDRASARSCHTVEPACHPAPPLAPHVYVKRSPTLSSVKVKSIGAVKADPPRAGVHLRAPRINRIVDALLQQQRHKQQQQQQARDKTPPKEACVRFDPRASLAHNKRALVQALQANLKRNEHLDTTPPPATTAVEDSELTDLSWLSTFKLSATLTSLSPPHSPPATPPPPPTINNNKRTPHTVCGDEADGGVGLLRLALPLKLLRKSEPQVPTVSVANDNCKQQQQQQLERPAYSFSALAAMAIASSPARRLCVQDIYAWITDTYAYYRSVPSGSWKNAVRHQLAVNTACFVKVDKNALHMRDFSGKGSLWSLAHTPRLHSPLDHLRHINDVDALLTPSVTPPTPPPTRRHRSGELRATSGHNAPDTNRMRMAAAIINPRYAMLKSQLPQQRQQQITVVRVAATDKSKRSKPLELQQQQQSSESLSELEAVNALLSMRSRSMSTITTATATAQLSALVSKALPQQQLQPAPTTPTSSECDLSRRSRRKQLFRPAKRVTTRSHEAAAAAAAAATNGDDDDDCRSPFAKRGRLQPLIAVDEACDDDEMDDE